MTITIAEWQEQHPRYDNKPHIPNVSTQGRFFESYDVSGSIVSHDLGYVCGCYKDQGKGKGHYNFGGQVKKWDNVTFLENFISVQSLLSQGDSIAINCDMCGDKVNLTQNLFDKINGILPETPVMETTFGDFYTRILNTEVSYWN
tara:strand:- start:4 stop:438 length:435 start_codon:yes stop_codon:yes gene_type:complete